MRKIIFLLGLVLCISFQVRAQFSVIKKLQPVTVSANTSDKPQSKAWVYDGKQWAVLANTTGTYVWRLDDTLWTNVVKVSTSTTAKADCKVVGNVTHIFLYKGLTSQLSSVEYDPVNKTYKLWSLRPGLVSISMDAGIETGTIDIDGTGRMWLASAGDTTINVRYSDSPYSNWSSPVTLANNVLDDDICTPIYLPALGKIGVFWSNQRTKLYGFKLHTDGDDPTVWSSDETPAYQYALNVGHGLADDHIHLTAGADGTLYCAVKTSFDTKGYVHLALLIRRPNGNWDNLYPVSTVGTRPVLVINEAQDKLRYVYAESESGGNIVYKETKLSTISFSPQYTLIPGIFNNASSIKDTYTSSATVLASNTTQAVSVQVSDIPLILPPDIPTLVSPVDNEVSVSLSPSLNWNTTNGATSYELQVASDFNFTSLESDQDGLTSATAQVNGLTNSTVYYWRVKAKNSAGASDWSPVWSFTTIPPVLAVPAAPILSAPQNVATGVAANPTLNWNTSANATSYQVQVASNSFFLSPEINQSNIGTNMLDIAGLANNTTYFWRVKASNAAGSSSWSTIWRFTTAPPVIIFPDVPTLVSPLDQETNTAVVPTLTWDPATNANSYTVQVSPTADFLTTVFSQNNLTTTSATVNSLTGYTTYFWRVQATNANGNSTWSAVRSFTTLLLPPDAPVIISPANLATSVALAPILLWNPTLNTANYHLQVATDAAFANLITDETSLTAATFPLTNLTDNSTYFWRVSAENAAGISNWSTSNFTTLVLPPAAVTLVSPADQVIDVPVIADLSWNGSANATSYQLQVSTAANFSSFIVNQANLTATTFRVNNLGSLTAYYWRVGATNPGGTTWSSTWSFNTVLLPPNAPTLNSPADLATNISITPTLNWNTSVSAVAYQLQVATDINFTSIVTDQTEITNDFATITGLSGSTPYYWHVRAANNSGNSPWSGTRRFTTLLLPPDPPVLTSPVNLATGVTVPTVFTWNPSLNAVSYQLQVSSVPDFSSIAVEKVNLTGTSASVVGLAPNTNYYWRVKAINSAGGNWAVGQQFTSDVNAPAGPLVVHWKMDESSGITLADASGFGNVANTIGNPTKVTGAFGLALKLNGLNQYATLADNPSLDINTAITVSAWIRPRLKANQVILKKALNATDGYELSLSSTGQVYFRFNNASGGDTYRLNSVALYPTTGSTWMHVAATFDGTNFKIYINGTENASKTLGSAVTINMNALALAIGAQSDGTSPLNGDLDDVRLYNAALNASQVRDLVTGGPVAVVPVAPALQLPLNQATSVNIPQILSWSASASATSYQMQLSASPAFTTNIYDQTGLTNTNVSVTGLNANTTYFWRVKAFNATGGSIWSSVWSFTTNTSLVTGPLVGHWKMDEPSGTTLTDASGFGNTGTTVGNPVRVTGQYGLALKLNGSSQYASVPSNPSLNIATNLTLAAWVRPKSKKLQYVMQKGKINATDGYELSLEKDGKVCFRINQATSGDTYRLSSATVYPTSGTTWMHIAATFDGLVMKIYINGTLNSTKTLTAPRTINSNNLALGIGAQHDGDKKMTGDIDDARIYNTALSANEIKSLTTLTSVRLASTQPIPTASEDQPIFKSIQEEFVAFPNPFSANAIIRFTLQNEGEYLLTLFNNKGMLVKVLDEGKAEAGEHRDLEIRAADLQNGLYIVKLQTRNEVKTLRLLLEK